MNSFRRQTASRHRYSPAFVLVVLLALVLAAAAAAGCGSDEGSDGTASPSPTSAGIQPGGTLVVAMQAGNGQYDPVMMAGSIGDIALQAQVLEKLVTLAQDFSVQPTLATSWEPNEDGTAWTFTLRDGVKFTNGQPFTAADVVYNMERLRAKDSPMATVYENVTDVVADDATHVTFQLATADSEFPASLTDYRSLMLSKSVKDPMKNIVGTGPFMLKSFAAEDRAVLVKNPDYWGTAEDGAQLPYLDQIDFVYSSDTAGMISGLQGGTVNFVGGLTAEQKQTLEADQTVNLLETDTNYCFELQIRTDRGPGKELAFRQALLAGTDRQAIVDLVAPGVGEAGNGTLVGPAYKDYYSSQQVAYDKAKAEQLLKDAGYGQGAKIKVVAQTADPVPAVATAWQAQMKELGIDVSIQQVPVDVFYGEEGEDTWYQADFSYVDYGTRASPITYFQLALTSDAPWNYSRWKNADFDELARQIPLELDAAKRADLYKQAQAILLEEVPMINFIINKAVAGVSADVGGVEVAPDYSQTLFATAHFTE